MLAMVLAGLFLSRDHWKARISEQASQDLLMQIENGKSEIVLTSLAPEIDGENEDWVAIEGLEKLLGVDFDRPEELTEAQELAQQKKLTAKGKLEIPKISLNLPVLEGTGKVGLRYGAGWFAMSAEPGQPGNCLLFGHRMKARGRLFNRLNELVRGDTVYIADMDAQLYTYTVVDKIEVLPENLFEELYKHTDGRYLSLITCTPQGVGSHRLIILCEIQSEL
jgi:LPXTG-site transpeptidase (sortase) family protein